MKKMIAVIAIFMIFFGGETGECISLADYFDGELVVYSDEYISGSVDLGFCYLNENCVSSRILGESIRVDDLEVGQAIQTLDATILKTEVLNDGTIVLYCYSDKISSSVIVGYERVNLQVAQKGDYIVLGWPLILGSF